MSQKEVMRIIEALKCSMIDDANLIFRFDKVSIILFQPYWKDEVGGDVGEDGISNSLALELIGD